MQWAKKFEKTIDTEGKIVYNSKGVKLNGFTRGAKMSPKESIMEKNLKYSALLSIYGNLLTDKQLSTMEYYYDDDLSLGEIAENTGISRQGVRDFIKRGEEMLDMYEEKIGLHGKMVHVDRIEDAAAKIREINKGAWSNKSIEKLANDIIDMAHKLK